MEGIKFELSTHQQNPVIKLVFAYNIELAEKVKKIKGILWSRGMSCWYLPDTIKNRRLLALPVRLSASLKLQELCNENKLALELFVKELKLKAYSASTLHTYRNEFLQLLFTLKKYPVNDLTNERLKDYFVYCLDKLALTENSLHSRINAIKFYFEQVLKRPSFIFDISRPKKRTSLPAVFSKEDIERILKKVENKKHKTMLLLAYSAGLRVSEVVALRLQEIDINRMIIRIIDAKGKKDRIIPLSKTALKHIREYIEVYKPVDFLFEGQDRQEAYSKRSLQLVLEKAKQAAGIKRKGSIHALRHSYATHLMDKGVDITYIQKLLGHNDIKTTLRYLHVTIRDLDKIESPAEDLDL